MIVNFWIYSMRIEFKQAPADRWYNASFRLAPKKTDPIPFDRQLSDSICLESWMLCSSNCMKTVLLRTLSYTRKKFRKQYVENFTLNLDKCFCPISIFLMVAYNIECFVTSALGCSPAVRFPESSSMGSHETPTGIGSSNQSNIDWVVNEKFNANCRLFLQNVSVWSSSGVFILEMTKY